MRKALLTASYLLSHLAAAIGCVSIVVIVPFVLMIVVAVIGNDPGGPLFFPLFLLLLLLTGLALSAFFSILAAISDFARLHWRTPLWISPVALFFVAFALSSLGGISLRSAVGGLILACAVAFGFSAYWLAVSSIWFLPRLLFRLFARKTEDT